MTSTMWVQENSVGNLWNKETFILSSNVPKTSYRFTRLGMWLFPRTSGYVGFWKKRLLPPLRKRSSFEETSGRNVGIFVVSDGIRVVRERNLFETFARCCYGRVRSGGIEIRTVERAGSTEFWREREGGGLGRCGDNYFFRYYLSRRTWPISEPSATGGRLFVVPAR